MIHVKICGITNLEDALFAQDCGADALGFIFYPKSKRYILQQDAKSIIQNLNPFINKVGIFVNTSSNDINEIAADCNLTHIQLHGDETVDFAESIHRPVIKALNFNSQLSAQIDIWSGYSLLIDSGNKETRGGTGNTLPWHELKSIVGDLRIILAGGLKPDNIKHAIKTLNPHTVDVSSGVEKSPGIKDKQLVKKFIEFVKQ